MKKIQYTEKMHARNLLRLLESGRDICSEILCPAGREFKSVDFSFCFKNHPCNVCKKFIKIKNESTCPCFELGRDTAVKKTWLALEEFYKGEIPCKKERK